MSDETPAKDTHAERDPSEVLAEIKLEREAIQREREALEKLNPQRMRSLCGAKTSSGSPCRRWPIEGGNRCVLHGGGSPLARMEAEKKLLRGVSVALDRLLDAISEHEGESPCPTCGCNASSRDPSVLRAAIALLDRSGFGPNLRLQHSNDDESSIGEVRLTIVDVDPDEKAQMKEEARLIRTRVRSRPEPEPAQLEEGDAEQPSTDGRNAVVIDLETN